MKTVKEIKRAADEAHAIKEALGLSSYYGLDLIFLMAEHPEVAEVARKLVRMIRDKTKVPKVFECCTKATDLHPTPSIIPETKAERAAKNAKWLASLAAEKKEE